MRLRGLTLAAAGLAALAAGSLVAWPLASARITRGLEERLGRETGLPWRIGGLGLGFAPGPTLSLRDVRAGTEAGGSGFGLTANRARIAGPFGLLLGSEGSIRVAVEGIALQGPIPGGQPGPGAGDAPIGPIDGVSGLRATLRGVEARLGSSGRDLAAAVESLDLVLDRASGTPKTEIRASLEGRDYRAALDLDLAAGAQPLRISLDPTGAGGRRLAATARAALGRTALRLNGLAGTIDGEPFSGTLGLDYAAKPRLTADLRFDALTLTGAEGARPAAPKAGLTVAVDADLIPDPSWFEPFDAKASLAFKRLTLGGLRLEGAAVAATVKEGGLDLTLASEAAYAGTARARYVLGRAGDGGRHQLSLSLNRARALPLLADLAGVRGLDGTASARIDVQATGRSLDGLLRSAKGLADLSVADGRLDGLDLAGLIELVPGRAAPRDEAGGDGFLRTRLGFLGGSFGVADGRAVTNDLALRTNVLEAKGAGSLDLVERTLDFRLTPTLIAPGAGRGRRGLDVPIRVTGPWADPSATADLSGIARDPGSAIDALQGLGESLFGGDGADPGGDLGAGLGGLLDAILPKPRERPAPGPRRP